MWDCWHDLNCWDFRVFVTQLGHYNGAYARAQQQRVSAGIESNRTEQAQQVAQAQADAPLADFDALNRQMALPGYAPVFNVQTATD